MGGEPPGRLQRLRAAPGEQASFRAFGLGTGARVVRAMTEDNAGNLWAGTADGQLWCIKREEAVDFTATQWAPPPGRKGVWGGAPSELLGIRCLESTPDGSVWIGYAGLGIGRLKDNHYARISAAEGLSDDIDHIRTHPDFGEGLIKVRVGKTVPQVRL